MIFPKQSRNVMFDYMLMTLAFPLKHKVVKTIEDKLNKDFNTLCDWFVDNKLSIHFGEDKTKSILFSPKNLRKRAEGIVIKRYDVTLKQFSTVEYLGCLLDSTFILRTPPPPPLLWGVKVCQNGYMGGGSKMLNCGGFQCGGGALNVCVCGGGGGGVDKNIVFL